jgi:hypothetical protein
MSIFDGARDQLEITGAVTPPRRRRWPQIAAATLSVIAVAVFVILGLAR